MEEGERRYEPKYGEMCSKNVSSGHYLTSSPINSLPLWLFVQHEDKTEPITSSSGIGEGPMKPCSSLRNLAVWFRDAEELSCCHVVMFFSSAVAEKLPLVH